MTDNARPNDAAEYCSFCGEPAVTGWHERETVAVCTQCAMKVFPSMIADSVVISGTFSMASDQVKRALREVERRYWRAMTFRLLKEGRR